MRHVEIQTGELPDARHPVAEGAAVRTEHAVGALPGAVVLEQHLQEGREQLIVTSW